MSLKNIQLPPKVMADLYSNLLIQGTKPEISSQMSEMQDTKSEIINPKSEAGGGKSEAGSQKSETPNPKTEIQNPKSETPNTIPEAYRFLGKHQQHVSIIVNFPGEAFLPEHHLQFLTKILGACRLNLGDVAIINHATLPVDINVLKEQLQPKYAWLLGIAPTDVQLPLTFPQFKDQSYAGTRYLYTPHLDEMNQENATGKQLKGQLWVCLKAMFNL